MNKLSTLAGLKYVYLIVFFTLLAGFFHPLIANTSFDSVVYGVFVLFVGLGGGYLLYRTTISWKKKPVLLGCGFVLVGTSLFLIMNIAGQV